MLVKSLPTQVPVRKPVQLQPMMKNVNEGKGIFAPAVVLTRNIVGKKRFNKLRGKAIALHSQVINEFCKAIGADAKQPQGLIRLAKKNGETWIPSLISAGENIYIYIYIYIQIQSLYQLIYIEGFHMYIHFSSTRFPVTLENVSYSLHN